MLAKTKSAHLVGGTKYEVPVLAPILIHHPAFRAPDLILRSTVSSGLPIKSKLDWTGGYKG